MARIFSIPPVRPFLPVLTDALYSGALTGDAFDTGDPLALSDVRIFLPTRRAVRSLTRHLCARNPKAAVLPDIRAIGDTDDAERDFDLPAGRLPETDLTVPSAPRQLFLMADLISRWKEGLPEDIHALLPDLPVSPADALWLAADLLQLIRTAETEGVDWGALDTLVPEDHAEYWQLTLLFLQTARYQWPELMVRHGLTDAAAVRDQHMRDYAAHLEETRPETPVIIAGSTGSVPATAELIRVISRLPRGAVILPGLDDRLDQESWLEIGGRDIADPSPSHPQYNMKLLLETLGVSRREVHHLGGDVSGADDFRLRFFAELMRPAKTTHLWSGWHSRKRAADAGTFFAGLTLVKADTVHEEARAITVAIRRALEDSPDKSIAVITPDRRLAQQILEEGWRWSLDLDDSSGMPLSKTAPGILFRLMAECAASEVKATTFLALAKHPLAVFGLEAGVREAGASALDRFALRGPRLAPGFDAIEDALLSSPGLPDRDRDDAMAVLSAIRDAISPLMALSSSEAAPPSDLIAAHRSAFDKALEGVSAETLTETQADELTAFAEWLTGVESADRDGFRVSLQDWPRCLDALMSGETYRVPRTRRDNIQIFGSIEARMQNADLTILGGLNEGTWPPATATGPFLSRAMMRDFGLPVPERRIGLSAHDFIQALGGREVIITRSMMSGGAPAVPSRFWMRLEAVAEEGWLEEPHRKGRELVALTRALDRAETVRSAKRPSPKPPVAARPRTLNVTEVETLIRDPYALYAKRILGLKPLEAIAEDPGARDRGIIIHEIVAEAVRAGITGSDPAARHELELIAKDAFSALEHYPDVHGLWWPRFESFADPFLSWNEGRAAEATDIAVEVSGVLDFRLSNGAPFQIRARADRIERGRDGSLAVFDFKTGTPPSKKLVIERLLSPQMPLEAHIAMKGGFAGIGQSDVSRLVYLAVARPSDPFRIVPLTQDSQETADCVSTIAERLDRLLVLFDSPESGYLSRRMPLKAGTFNGDYDHLARAREWSSDDGESA